MKHRQEITLRVTDWPAFHRTTEVNLDAALFPDDDAIRAHADRRYGAGTLSQSDDGSWTWRRDVRGFALLGKALFRILHHGYA